MICMIKMLFTVCVILTLVSTGLFAQYDMQAQIPVDPNVRIGKLDNGLTYYIRHNEEPKERACFYIVQNVGAILEEDNQNGLAHFLEHMAFNGTKHFPGRKGIVNVLTKHGVAFGRNVNAYTSQDETVYNISEVPTTKPGLLDTCLLVLHDWSHYLELADKEIDGERGVISEEWRTRMNAGTRIRQQALPVVLNDSKYAYRNVIGDIDIIKNFEYQTLRDYYQKWYRPDLQAIVVVGDFDVDEMEKKVCGLFTKIPAPVNPAMRENCIVPSHDDIKFVCATDKEVTASTINVIIKHPAASKEQKQTHQYLRDDMIRSFYNMMLNARISELTQTGNPPFIKGGGAIGKFLRGVDAYTLTVTAKPNEEAEALEAIWRENERIRRHGFTKEEFDRAKTNLMMGMEYYRSRMNKTKSDSYAKIIKSHFLEGAPMLEQDYQLAFGMAILPTITLEEVSAIAGKYTTLKNMVISIEGPSEGVKHLTEQEALTVLEKVKNSEIDVYQDVSADKPLLAEEPEGSKIVKTKKLLRFDAEEWILENGAKVVFRKADFDKNQVSVTSYSKGGTSLYEMDKLASAEMLPKVIGAYGLGEHTAMVLNKILTGKEVRTSLSLTNAAEAVSGNSSIKDFETLMQLIYMRFEKPRFDKFAHDGFMERNYAAIASADNDPNKAKQDSLKLILNDYNPRVLLSGKEYLDRVSFEQVEEIYRDRFKDISDFTFFIVGNIDADVVKPLVEKYLGAVKSYGRKENWIDRKVRNPKGKMEKVIELPLEEPKATVFTYFNKETKVDIRGNLYQSILKGVLQQRYMSTIREKEGCTYGVSVQSMTSNEPRETYGMNIMFDCDPEKAEHLKSLIYAEIDKLQKEGPTREEVDVLVAGIKKNSEQAKAHNAYWMSALRTYYLRGEDITAPKNFDKIIDNITPKNIQKFAKRIFKGADVVDLMFVPEKK